MFALLAPLVWLATVLAPSSEVAWAVLRGGARLALKASAIPVRVHGSGRLPATAAPVVIVSNHASYLDVLVLMAVLCRPVRFVAKVELGQSWLTGWPLRRIGTLFVDRAHPRQGARDFRRVEAAAAAGSALLVFPEGTFRDQPGLLPFQLGAFLVAVDRHLPVQPVALSGTRTILPGDHLRPRPGEVTVTVGDPIPPTFAPSASDRRARAEALANQARRFIAAHCGEPDVHRGASSKAPPFGPGTRAARARR